MPLNKESRFIFSVENFLPEKELLSLQETLLNLEYKHLNRQDGTNIHYGFGCKVHPNEVQDGAFIKRIKETFHPDQDLKIHECRAHIRYNHNEPLPHCDNDKYGFLLYVKGEPLLNNGTGFYNNNGELYHHIGFVENTALFFNAAKILHTNMQSFGDSSPRYCINVFYDIE